MMRNKAFDLKTIFILFYTYQMTLMSWKVMKTLLTLRYEDHEWVVLFTDLSNYAHRMIISLFAYTQRGENVTAE